MGCITPCGIPYITTRGGPLCGLEALSLQGLPLDRLLLTKESQRELQDLAGNAMSSTVVGAATLSALIVAYKALDAGSTEEISPNLDKYHDTPKKIVPREDQKLVQRNLDASGSPLSVHEIIKIGNTSRRLCVCEGQSIIKRKGIQKCSLCGHTSCTSCGGNPTHNYETMNDIERSSPLTFGNMLKEILPMRLAFSNLSPEEYLSILPEQELNCETKNWEKFLEAVTLACKDELRFSAIKRGEKWRIVYEGRSSFLNLVIGETAEWFFFAKPLDSEPALSLNREILSKPIAKMKPVSSSLFEGQWEICAPISSSFKLDISGVGKKVESYEAKCGLEGSFFGTTVWSGLAICGPDDVVSNLDVDIRGNYELLQNCGTANGSLHKKAATNNSPAVYLFLDPTKFGPADLDSFVFSLSHERLARNESRPIIAELTPTWRPSNVDSHASQVKAFYRKWVKCPRATLGVFDPSAEIVCRSLDPDTALKLSSGECHHENTTLLEFAARAEAVKLPWKSGPWEVFNLMESSVALQHFSWLLQRATTLNSFEKWRQVSSQGPMELDAVCTVCAPIRPRILWGRDHRNRIKPYENPEDAAVYERQIKARPPAFLGFTRIDENGIGHLRISVNVNTLLHQAYEKLVGSGNAQKKASFYWRLLSNAPDVRDLNFGKFNLTHNRKDRPSGQPPNFHSYQLRPEQLRSLSWMIEQEAEEPVPFEEEEVEEALLPFMMWRAEAKVTHQKFIRGGVLADEVGYGKTALILGLIDTQFDRDRQKVRHTDGAIPVKATLVVVPKMMVTQWKEEISKFLGRSYNVKVFETLTQLSKMSIKDIEDADIILLSWGVLETASYHYRMQQFAAVPAVPRGDGRIFDDWLKDAVKSIENHVNILRAHGPKELLNAIHAKRRALEEAESYYTYYPSKRLRGAALAQAAESEASSATMATAKQQTSKPSARKRKAEELKTAGSTDDRPARKTWDDIKDFNISSKARQAWQSLTIPVLHMFEFNRLVIDEFTYVSERKLGPVLNLKARSVWVLSGTPPLNNFTDVQSIAPFFGVHLGVDADEGEKNPSTRLANIRRERSGTRQYSGTKEDNLLTR